MKRFFILATAAIVALASCAKTEVVYNDAPEQIAFKQITGAMTKAAHTLEDGNLGVIAHQGEDVYFGNTPFAGTSGSFTADKYWPYEGTLDFTVYYPHVNAADYDYDSKVLTIPGVTADDAHYFGSQRYLNTAKGTTAVVLKHLSAAVVVTADLGSLYTVQSVTLNDAPSSGDVTVTYDADGKNPVVATKTGFAKTNKSCLEGTVYVLPGTQTNFTVVFKQNEGAGTVYTKTVDLSAGNWQANYKYTYNIGITPAGQITFTATVVDFEQNIITAPSVQ